MSLPRQWLRLCAAPLLAWCWMAPAMAQYKVVGADGTITYTDRPTALAPGAQLQPLRRDALAAAIAVPLPGDLRALVARFPVTLYTAGDCQPCDAGRRLLLQRGVPYSERLVASDDDAAALQRLTGGRTVPSLTVGGQALRGLQEGDWQGTLDLAGYPKESRLPRGWQPPTPAPLVAVRDAAEAPAPATARPAPEPAAPAVDPAAPAIRF